MAGNWHMLCLVNYGACIGELWFACQWKFFVQIFLDFCGNFLVSCCLYCGILCFGVFCLGLWEILWIISRIVFVQVPEKWGGSFIGRAPAAATPAPLCGAYPPSRSHARGSQPPHQHRAKALCSEGVLT